LSDTVKQPCRFFCASVSGGAVVQRKQKTGDHTKMKKTAKQKTATLPATLTEAVRQKYHVGNGLPGALKLHPAREYLGGLSVPTMHRLIQRGLLRPCRSLRHLLFSREELDRFIHDGMS
jgi:hypothetical protein